MTGLPASLSKVISPIPVNFSPLMVFKPSSFTKPSPTYSFNLSTSTCPFCVPS